MSTRKHHACTHTHVQGYKQRNGYITTQGPLENTVSEFWRMIWEFKSKVIVMLCRLEEDGKVLLHAHTVGGSAHMLVM